jgi:hypothetical protein
MDRREIEALIGTQLEAIKQPDLVACIRRYLVSPRLENRDWDYGEPGATFPCWIFAEDVHANTAMAYCENGFGPTNPWGSIFLAGEFSSIGMDSQWFVSLEDAARNSPLWLGENPRGYEVQ